ncbi:MAG: right-handed parallel beta-helix repeat-containing protein [Candidatus Krumholzibacteriia bacterium]
MTPRRLAALVLLVGLCRGGAAPAAILRVDPQGTGPWPRIQAALDAAAPGDVIELEDGLYAGDGNRDLDFRGKAVGLRSRGGDPSRCILDCADDDPRAPHRGLRLQSGEGAGTRVSGLTIRHGQALADSPPAGSGGAVLCRGASPVFTACIFTACRATTGGAVACEEGACPRFERCLFIGNTAAFGGGLLAYRSGPTLVDCRFADNTAGNGGGAAFLAGSARLVQCRFLGNSATTGGGLTCEQGAAVELDGCEIVANVATLGGGLFINAAGPRLVRCRFAGDSAGAGAGLCLRGGARAWLTDSGIVDSPQGAAVDCDDGSAVLAVRSAVTGSAEGDWTGCLAGQGPAPAAPPAGVR